MVRNLGEFVLTGHLVEADRQVVTEIEVATAGGVVLYRHRFEGVFFGDRAAAAYFVSQRLAEARISAAGVPVW